MIAAEQAGRRAFLLELDPLYVDVIVGRWEAFTGLRARQVAGAVPERGGDGGLEYRADSDLDALLVSYFRLDDEMDAIWSELAARDEKLRELHEERGHVRLRPDSIGPSSLSATSSKSDK